MHGGSSLRGVAHPNYKHGRHSKYLPSRLLERYEASASDPEILDLTAEIALVDARSSDVLSRVDAGESGRLWRALGAVRREFLAARGREDQQGMADALAEILNLIGRGGADFEAWAEIVDLLERRRRLVDSEQKRRIAMHESVQVGEAVAVMVRIADAVKDAALEHITDARERQAVLVDVQQALSVYLGERLPAQADRGD